MLQRFRWRQKGNYQPAHCGPRDEIEQCGWKGKRIGNVGVYEKQALVLINYGNATGKEILEFANSIQQSVYKKFGVSLEFEVNVV